MKVIVVNKLSGEVFEISNEKLGRLKDIGKVKWDIQHDIYVFDPEHQGLIVKMDGKYGIFILDTDSETIYDVLRFYNFEIRKGKVLGMNSISKHNILNTPLDKFTNLGGYNVVIVNDKSDLDGEEFRKLVKSTLNVLKGKFNNFNTSKLFYVMLKTSGTSVIKKFTTEHFIKNYVVDKYPGPTGVNFLMGLVTKKNINNIVSSILINNKSYHRSKNGGIKILSDGFQIVLNEGYNTISVFKQNGKFVYKHGYTSDVMSNIMRVIRERKDKEFMNLVKRSFTKEQVYDQTQIEDIKERRLSMNITTYFGLNVRIPKNGYKITFINHYHEKIYINAKLNNEINIKTIITKIKDYFNVK